MTAIAPLEKTFQKTNVWLREALVQLDWSDARRAYTATKAVLHALRDRLPTPEIAQLGAQLPTLLRGVYYEGWNPSHTPSSDRTRDAFLEQIQSAFQPRADVDPNHVARSIIRLLLKHVSQGEMEQVRNSLPHDVREFWPTVIPFMRKAS
jgi:uncharacterized protein (DUF2267 family)